MNFETFTLDPVKLKSKEFQEIMSYWDESISLILMFRNYQPIQIMSKIFCFEGSLQ